MHIFQFDARCSILLNARLLVLDELQFGSSRAHSMLDFFMLVASLVPITIVNVLASDPQSDETFDTHTISGSILVSQDTVNS